MSYIFVFLFMVFCHIIDDYNLQGWLASAKQKSYWEANAPEKLYKNDCIMALFMHSLSWAFMIMLPIAIAESFNVGWIFLLVFLINTAMHMFIDNEKANNKTINLVTDQLLHLVQIAGTFVIWAFGLMGHV